MGTLRQVGGFVARVRARVWVVALVAALGAGLCLGMGEAQAPGERTMLIEPPAPLLPAALGNMKRAAEGDAGDGLGSVDAADAAVMTEDGLKRFARSDYAEGAEHGSVTVYQFNDASGAVAAYDYFRRPGMRPEKLGDSAVSNGDELQMRSGVNVVRANFRMGREAMDTLTKELIVHLPKVYGTSALPPPLPTFLPAKGLDAESVRYALGPKDYTATGGVLPAAIVEFGKSAETVTAKYRDGGELTLIEYPTPEIAGDRGRAIEAELKQEGPAAGTVKVRREGPMLMVTTGAWKPAEAAKLIDGIHLRDVLTWNKPLPLNFQTEVQKTYSLLSGIAALCGMGALAAIVLGLFFGGGRALIRVMQGKPAATEPEFLRIDLRGAVGKSLTERQDPR